MEANRSVFAASRARAGLWRLCASLRALLRRVKVRRTARSLRVCETLPLGERRLLMVIQFERKRFLIGATNQSISLLDRLDERNQPGLRSDDSPWVNSPWKGPH